MSNSRDNNSSYRHAQQWRGFDSTRGSADAGDAWERRMARAQSGDMPPNERFASSTRLSPSLGSTAPPAQRGNFSPSTTRRDASSRYGGSFSGSNDAVRRAEDASRYADARNVRINASSDQNRVRYASEHSYEDSRPSRYARTSRQDFGDQRFGRAESLSRGRGYRDRILINDESLRMDKVTGVRERGSDVSDELLEQMHDKSNRTRAHEHHRAPSAQGRSRQNARQQEIYAKRAGNAWHSQRKERQRRTIVVGAVIVVLVVAFVVAMVSCALR